MESYQDVKREGVPPSLFFLSRTVTQGDVSLRHAFSPGRTNAADVLSLALRRAQGTHEAAVAAGEGGAAEAGCCGGRVGEVAGAVLGYQVAAYGQCYFLMCKFSGLMLTNG